MIYEMVAVGPRGRSTVNNHFESVVLLCCNKRAVYAIPLALNAKHAVSGLTPSELPTLACTL